MANTNRVTWSVTNATGRGVSEWNSWMRVCAKEKENCKKEASGRRTKERGTRRTSGDSIH